ncbi:nitroreductase [Rhodococcus sp. X156]|uniref:nitroreductase n=1 Tax=Rhodococcus sp. X156 TaxID=2499145 RepID=UPI000FD89B19|nr:nitroreductase [Rhodococcus sp. X156]
MTDRHTADAVADVLAARYSCRGFLPEEVPEETMRTMFTRAQRTASWCNSQAWQVHVCSGEQTSRFAKGIAEWAATHPQQPDLEPPASYEGAYLERRRSAGFGLYQAMGIGRDDPEGRMRQGAENFRFFGAPHVAVISSPRALGTYGAVDCGGYVATLLTVAQSLGVATIAQAAIALYSDFVHDFLGLGDDRSVVCAVSFGYADPAHPANSFRTDRAELDQAVTFLR